MRLKQNWFLVFVLCAFLGRSQPSFEAFQSTDRIIWGQTDTLTLILKSPTDSISWFELRDTLRKEIEVVDARSIDTGVYEGGWELRQEVLVTSFDTGFFVIAPFQVVVGMDTLTSNPLLLRVDEGVDQLQADLLPIADILDEPLSFWESIWSWGKYVLGVLVLVAAYLLIRRYYLSKRNKQAAQVVIPEKTFKELFDETLQAIESDKDWEQGRLKLFYTRTSTLLRKYLEYRFAVKAMEQTTAEILRQLEATALKQMDQERLGNTLRLSDMVKFAKGQGVAGQHEAMIKILKELTEHFGFLDNE